jgi:hypothetical protein
MKNLKPMILTALLAVSLFAILILPGTAHAWYFTVGEGYQSGAARIQANPAYIPGRGIVANPYNPIPNQVVDYLPDGTAYYTSPSPDYRVSYSSAYRPYTFVYPQTTVYDQDLGGAYLRRYEPVVPDYYYGYPVYPY